MSVAERKQQEHITRCLPEARRVRREQGNKACASYLRRVAEELPDNSEEAQMEFFTGPGNRVLRGE